MPESKQRAKVTVEDLLHLKRAERPAPEFWSRFEQELRQKQLSALLEKRPWWQELPELLSRRVYVPVGATAVLAFTLVSVKYFAPNQEAQVEPTPAQAPVALSREAAAPIATASSPLVNRSESTQSIPDDRAIAAAPLSAEASNETVELMPMLVAPREVEKPSDRLLASNLTRLEQPDADFVQAALSNRLSSPARDHVAAPAAEELASVPTASARRSRLFARYDGRQLSPEPSLPEVVRHRLTRGWGDAEPDRSRLARDIDPFRTPLPQIAALRF